MGKLGEAISYNVKELVKMEDGTVLPIVAWHARNLLELSIWTEYCIQSQENAVRFAVDAMRDLDDIIKRLPQDEIDARPETKRWIENFESVRTGLAGDIGSEDLSKPYTSVRTAAAAIGKLIDYEAGMKVYSKWAHPTALAVMTGPPPGDAQKSTRINITRAALTMASEASRMAKAFNEETVRKLLETSKG